MHIEIHYLCCSANTEIQLQLQVNIQIQILSRAKGVCVGLSSGGALEIESGGSGQSSLYSNNHTTSQVAQAYLGFLIPAYK